MAFVLWDASDVWGPLAVWGVRGLGVGTRIVTAAEIAGGLLARERPGLLVVPGGFGRHKFAALGQAGQEAVREYVKDGGAYLGFCGGAGLALTGEHGLGICPWRRAGYANRVQHYMSGHFETSVAPDDLVPETLPDKPLLPVWWPGRFAPGDGGGDVTVLASYGAPGADFWLADLPVNDLPPSIFAEWEARYGFSPSPSSVKGEPCVIRGKYGNGQYVLAYTHLETPESLHANAWLAHLARTMGRERVMRETVPAWDLEHLTPAWKDPDLLRMWDDLRLVTESGIAAGLFFVRSSWLLGWRAGIPGAVLNTVRAHLHSIIATPPAEDALRCWSAVKSDLVPAFGDFARKARSYLLDERLAMALAKDPPPGLTPDALLAERANVFGSSGMTAHAGGLLSGLLPCLDELALRQLRGQRNA